jgi:hypothetical protein
VEAQYKDNMLSCASAMEEMNPSQTPENMTKCFSKKCNALKSYYSSVFIK